MGVDCRYAQHDVHILSSTIVSVKDESEIRMFIYTDLAFGIDSCSTLTNVLQLMAVEKESFQFSNMQK